MVVAGFGIDEVYLEALGSLQRYGKVQPSRYGTTRELLNVQLEQRCPRSRILHLKGRGESIYAQVAEAIWVAAGSKDVRLLEPFLPRAREFCETDSYLFSPTIWRSGYGERIRSYNGVDQLRVVYQRLKKDPESRRGFIVISNPNIDHLERTDVACNQVIDFLVRDNRLLMTVANRSNDAIWGYLTNQFVFSYLQELLAGFLGVEVGTYVHNAMSFHVYDHHWDRVDKVLTRNARAEQPNVSLLWPVRITSWEVWEQLNNLYFSVLDQYVCGESSSNVFSRFVLLANQLTCVEESPGVVYYLVALLKLLQDDPKEFLRGFQIIYAHFSRSIVAQGLLVQPENLELFKKVIQSAPKSVQEKFRSNLEEVV